MTLDDLKELAAPELAARWDAATAALQVAQEQHAVVHAELERRYRKKAERMLRKAGRADGTVHVLDGALDIQVTLPRRDEIDQAEMAKAIARLEKLGSNWRDFVSIGYAVSRSALKGLPEKTRQLLERAISVKVGRLRFAISEAKPAALKKAA